MAEQPARHVVELDDETYIDLMRLILKHPDEISPLTRTCVACAKTGDRMNEIKANAFEEGFDACVQEHIAQDKDARHPITRVNPYRRAAA